MSKTHGWGQSVKGRTRRLKAKYDKIDKWVKTCLSVNAKLEDRKNSEEK